MEYRSLGRTGLRVSALGLGTMTFGETDLPFARGVHATTREAKRAFDAALARGVNFIDTANIYGDGEAEKLIGQWSRRRRHELVIATKVRYPMGLWHREVLPNGHGLSRRHIIEACEASLKRLGTDFIDLYQAHAQDIDVPIEETLRAFEDLVRAGKVRYIGCSNYTGYRLVESLWTADKLGSTRYASVQMHWSLSTRDAERELVPACRAFGLGVIVYHPLDSGFLTGKYRRNAPSPGGSRYELRPHLLEASFPPAKWRTLRRLQVVASRLKVTPAAVALAWLLARPETSVVLVGAKRAEQLIENFGALELRLSADDVKELEDASRTNFGHPYDHIARHGAW